MALATMPRFSALGDEIECALLAELGEALPGCGSSEAVGPKELTR
jgi:hypothetical protein